MLTNKIAVVTGCARGLGFAIAKMFFDNGAVVIGVDRMQPENGDSSYSFFNSNGQKTCFKQVDITSEESVKEFSEFLKKEYGEIDILVNNAGVHIIGNIESISVENFKKTLDVNIFGTFLVTKYLIGMMKDKAEGASIINVSSNLGLMAAKDRVAYPTSKAAIINFTRCMAMDYAEHNVRVNAIAPGAINTEMTINYMKEMNDPEYEKENKALHLLNRFAEPDEIAQCALFLASDKSSYCTGSVLSVDGGYTSGK